MERRALSRREVLGIGGAALAAAVFPGPASASAGKETDRGKRRSLLMFTKSSGYEHGVIKRKGDDLGHAEKVVTELGRKHGFDVLATKDGTIFDGDLDRFDAFLFYTSGDLTRPGNDKNPPMSPRGKQALLEAIAGGKGFAGSHCASDSFHTKGDRRENQKEKDPYIAMLGGEFISHGPQQKARMRVTSPDFPGLGPAGDGFVLHEEWYSLKNFAPDLHVILVNETEGMKGRDYERPPFPSTWARRHGKGRVFYTAMGHREDVWTNDIFQSILIGGLGWVFGDRKAEVKPNIEKVTPKADVMPPPR